MGSRKQTVLAPASTPDVLAMLDVVTTITERSDAMTFEEATTLRPALEALGKAANEAARMLKTQQLQLLDGQPRTVGSVVYAKKDDGKWRPDHVKIRNHIQRVASSNEDGELIGTMEAVDKAVDLMYSLFVAPTTEPKAGGLELLGVTKRDVETWEKTGSKLVEINLAGEGE